MAKQKLSFEDGCKEIFKILFEYISESDNLHMRFLNNQVAFYKQLLEFKIEEEPLKIFRKKHSIWESEVNEIEEKLFGIYKNIEDEFQFQKDFYNSLKSSN